MKALPPIPRSVKLPTGRIPVRRVKRMLKDEDTVGKFDWVKRVMYLDSELDVNAAWLTLEHELAHAILLDAGIIEWPDRDATGRSLLEERVCDAIAAARVAEKLSR
jgi:Zn-dependent peptidase ImmA (M78 family)